jgi:hypothetical protein
MTGNQGSTATTPARARGFSILLVLLGALLLAPGSARADKCDDQEPGKGEGKNEPKFRIEERNGQKVYVIDKAITVCGKVPRPLVAYVLQARSINYQWETLKQDFLPKILESVKKDPF